MTSRYRRQLRIQHFHHVLVFLFNSMFVHKKQLVCKKQFNNLIVHKKQLNIIATQKKLSRISILVTIQKKRLNYSIVQQKHFNVSIIFKKHSIVLVVEKDTFSRILQIIQKKYQLKIKYQSLSSRRTFIERRAHQVERSFIQLDVIELRTRTFDRVAHIKESKLFNIIMT